ncbi:hypothetical protein F443_14225 [Phytophthora nicotianae P1569]|uniref:Uncharacterized protein n=1 Tax=Phytophthora nicotianae P1569 TaxID=1317065 RepID=V9EMA6_PHYNI|nr:hypothetical protein F443_14225 [Phytophthora nicotianae P1569]
MTSTTPLSSYLSTSSASETTNSLHIVSLHIVSLHIVSHDGTTRFPLTDTQLLNKVDALNYALQPGQGVNVVALTPMELHRQDALLAACRKRRSGIPPSVLASLSAPFSPDEIVPLVKPATLQLVHVCRQHIIDYSLPAVPANPKISIPTRRTSQPSAVNETDTQLRNYDSADDESASCSEDDDVRKVQYTNAPLAKHRRFNGNDNGSCSDSSVDSYADAERTTRHQRGIVFHPSPSDRRIHAAIGNRRHTASWMDTVAASEKGMNLWDFSSKNDYPTPLKVSGFGNLIRSKTVLHKFGQHFYNGKTVDHALSDPTMARLLAYWINAKFSLFRNKDLSDGLREATKVSTQFCRSDDKLETNVRGHRTTSNTDSRNPTDVYAQLPLGEDGRKLCLKILSRPGCQFTKCSIAHFRPESLAEGVQYLISERPSCEQEERERYKIVMATLNKSRVLNQASIYENYQKNAVGLSPPPLRPNLIDDVDADQVQFWSTFAEPNKWSLSDVVLRHLRKEQHEGRYLIVASRLLELWPEIFISPAGAVDKAAAATVDIRLINDYSIPPVHSINDFTDHESLPSISYNPPRDTANRIHFIASSHLVEYVLMMIGDVSVAFRHISIHADSVHMFAFVFEDRLVVDLSCGFGWCGSPAFYTLVGSIINALYEHGNKLTRQFHGNVWCDDHTCIEVDRGSACFNANLSLRWAMATDTSAGTVSIPVDKLTKASDRVDDLVSSKFATRTIQLQVIGSFRHVASSLPPARAFLQCLQEKATACPKYCRRVLSASTLDDLRWFQAVLRHPARFNAIPIIHFADMSESRFHVFTDASGDGLYVLEPTLKRYIHQRFSTDDLTDTSIHVRELRSVVLAALHWGPYRASESNTTRTHVQFHIDNTNAVAWANHRSSRHSVVKMHNRLLSLAEFQYNLVFTASHIAHKLNMMAEAGSRGSSQCSHVSHDRLEGEKNDQFGRSAWRTMNTFGGKLLCPLKGLHHIRQARKLLKVEADQHLCAALTAREVARAIKNTARELVSQRPTTPHTRSELEGPQRWRLVVRTISP